MSADVIIRAGACLSLCEDTLSFSSLEDLACSHANGGSEYFRQRSSESCSISATSLSSLPAPEVLWSVRKDARMPRFHQACSVASSQPRNWSPSQCARFRPGPRKPCRVQGTHPRDIRNEDSGGPEKLFRSRLKINNETTSGKPRQEACRPSPGGGCVATSAGAARRFLWRPCSSWTSFATGARTRRWTPRGHRGHRL